MRVEILGYFGSGKTYLANELAKLGALNCAYEDHTFISNWGLATISGETPSLSYELLFLLQHNLKLHSLDPAKDMICDWSFLSDYLWATSRLNRKDIDIYKIVHAAILKEHSSDVIYIYLNLGLEEIKSRLLNRARAEEQGLKKRQIENALKKLKKSVELINPDKVIIVNQDDSVDYIQELLTNKLHSYKSNK